MAPIRAIVILIALQGVVTNSYTEPAAPTRIEQTVFLMGTVATIVVEAAERQTALEKLDRIIRIIETTEAELSTWRQNTIISKLNRHPIGIAFSVPPDVCGLFVRLKYWHNATSGAFDPSVGNLIEAWELRTEGRQPEPERLREAVKRSGFHLLTIDQNSCTVTRQNEVKLDAGGFGKGEALDRVRQTENDRPGEWLIDFGGQLAVSGNTSSGAWQVALANPQIRTLSVIELELSEGSLATSGGSERDITLKTGARIGHILDARTGDTVSRTASVTVWHPDAFVADALSTALYVMGADEGANWAEARNIAACFIISTTDTAAPSIHTTTAFRQQFKL